MENMKQTEQTRQEAPKMIEFGLPDGRIVKVNADVAPFASYIDYELADGRMVIAVRMPGQN